MPERVLRFQTGTHTWIIIREWRDLPKAIVHRVIDTNESERFLLFTWRPSVDDRRLVGIYETLDAADKAVPFPGKPSVPLHPHASQREWLTWQEANAAEKAADKW